MEELEFTTYFIKFYTIFTIIMLLTSMNSDINIFPNITIPTTFTLGGILTFVGSIASFMFSLIIYTIPNYTILNYILWSLRLISLLELLIYFKKLVHPTAN